MVAKGGVFISGALPGVLITSLSWLTIMSYPEVAGVCVLETSSGGHSSADVDRRMEHGSSGCPSHSRTLRMSIFVRKSTPAILQVEWHWQCRSTRMSSVARPECRTVLTGLKFAGARKQCVHPLCLIVIATGENNQRTLIPRFPRTATDVSVSLPREKAKWVQCVARCACVCFASACAR